VLSLGRNLPNSSYKIYIWHIILYSLADFQEIKQDGKIINNIHCGDIGKIIDKYSIYC